MTLIGWQELLFVFVILLLIGTPLLVVYIIAKSVFKRYARQEIHRGLERMEKRVEALETIILDRSAKIPEASDSREP